MSRSRSLPAAAAASTAPLVGALGAISGLGAPPPPRRRLCFVGDEEEEELSALTPSPRSLGRTTLEEDDFSRIKSFLLLSRETFLGLDFSLLPCLGGKSHLLLLLGLAFSSALSMLFPRPLLLVVSVAFLESSVASISFSLVIISGLESSCAYVEFDTSSLLCLPALIVERTCSPSPLPAGWVPRPPSP